MDNSTAATINEEQSAMEAAIASGMSMETYKRVRAFESDYRTNNPRASNRNVRRAMKKKFPNINVE